MELLIILVFIGLVFAGWLLFAALFGIGRAQKRAESNSGPALDALFDGRDQVIFEGTLVGLKPETVMAGASERGYKVISVAEGTYGTKTIVFEKTAA